MKLDAGKLVSFNEPLRPKDTATQTEGCRHTNPDICAHNCLAGVCAFVRPDGICLRPSRAWPRQFEKLGST